MQSTVLLPMNFFGGSRLIFGSWDVRLIMASRATPTPGIIMPPITCFFSLTTVKVVAVPRSTTTSGQGYSSMAATAPTTRSEPSWAGLSIRMSRPVLTPGPTTSGSRPVTLPAARRITPVRGGTADERIAPASSFLSIPYISRTVLMLMAYSSSDFFVSV